MTRRNRLLLSELAWMTRLRWLVGAAVIGVTLIDGLWLNWYDRRVGIAAVGGVIVLYNILLWVAGRSRTRTVVPATILAAGHIFLDLGCLTVLTVWTGGIRSPFASFFVFHMVFASLLLRRQMAYTAAVASIIMLSVGLMLSGQWPPLDTAGDGQFTLLDLAGRAVALLLLVYLTNHITVSLRRYRLHLRRQNLRNRQLLQRLQEQQRAMVQQEKMVALGQMAAGIAHEVANPLASMDGVLQLMQRNPARMTAQNIRRLRDQVERINQTVKMLNEFSHPTEFSWQTVRIDDVIEASLEMLRYDQRYKAVQIDWESGGSDGTANLQPHAMQQVLVNLLINAFDAMAEVDCPRLQLSTTYQNNHCTISIADNGHGISSAHIDQIFDPFFTTKPVGKGTGLGLAVSTSLVRNQGGRIDVSSTPGSGTTMSVTLPMQQA
jgi:signal transduction histidine kinase